MSNINVYVRFRPVFHNADEEPEDTCVRTIGNDTIEMVNLRNTRETVSYKFQQVFGEDSSQEEIFGTVVQPVLSRFTDDIQNVSVFAYGPTGSGKTFTILGMDETPGFIPRTMHHLFARMRHRFASTNTKVTFSMSYFEIYQEKVYDLLGKLGKVFSIRQDEQGNILVPGISEIPIENFNDFEKHFVPASNHRRVAKTRINERSSRSHTILLIKLITQERAAPFTRRVAKLSIVDLAGSEDNRQTGNKGIRLKESSSINTSLHVLGKVVIALSIGSKSRIPYRDSKLTRLLQDSLGGSAHTCMVVNLSPEMSSIFDTQRALSFATKTSTVINRPFTRESCLTELPMADDDADRQTKVLEKKPCEPILSPSLREQAKKLKLEIDVFENLENFSPEKNSTSVKDEQHQHELIQRIRDASRYFKNLQQKPKNEEEDEVKTTTCCSTIPTAPAPTLRPRKSHVFTIKLCDTDNLTKQF